MALQAAALAAGVTEGHPFIDGNKRTAALALETFLDYNGYELAVSEDHFFEWMLALAEGRMLPDELGDLLRPHVSPIA